MKRKEGFPSITDKGVMDVVIAGQGLSFKVAMETADANHRNHFFKVDKVDVSIKNMNIILKQSNHKLLFKLFKPLLLKVMNPVIQKVVEKEIRANIDKLDAFLWSVNQEAEKAKRDVQNDPENAPNVFTRYQEALQAKFTQAKQKKEAVKNSDTKVNMAVTQHDSLFPQIKLPGGISTKATEYKELAAKGDKWESPIFTIGSAKESTGLPTPAPITRKSHAVNKQGLVSHEESTLTDRSLAGGAAASSGTTRGNGLGSSYDGTTTGLSTGSTVPSSYAAGVGTSYTSTSAVPAYNSTAGGLSSSGGLTSSGGNVQTTTIGHDTGLSTGPTSTTTATTGQNAGTYQDYRKQVDDAFNQPASLGQINGTANATGSTLP